MEQKRKIELTNRDIRWLCLGNIGQFSFFCKYIIPEERTIIGEWMATDGDKPVPATLTYVPSDIREEEKLLNNENATARDFLSLDWDDWTVCANGKEMNSFEAIKYMFS